MKPCTLLCLLLLCLASCQNLVQDLAEDGTLTEQEAVQRVERLFDYEGCTVYRFRDPRYPRFGYFARCPPIKDTP